MTASLDWQFRIVVTLYRARLITLAEAREMMRDIAKGMGK